MSQSRTPGDLVMYPTPTGATEASEPFCLALPTAGQFYGTVPVLSRHGTIRLLDIDPSGDVRAPLSGQIRTARLADKPSFGALSYVWGEWSTPAPTILCRPHNFYLGITSNCDGALRSIRKMFGGVTIWVDSICINQDSDAEKEEQIPLMGDIYAQAEAVYVWLGEGSSETIADVESLKRVARLKARLPFNAFIGKSKNIFISLRCLWRTWKDIPCEPTEDIFVCEPHISIYELTPFATLVRIRTQVSHSQTQIALDRTRQLLDKRWIRRAWTFQEIVIASNPVIICGESCLAWEDIVSVIYFPISVNAEGRSEQPALPRPWSRNASSERATRSWRSVIDLWVAFPTRGFWDDTTSNKHRPRISFQDYAKSAISWGRGIGWVVNLIPRVLMLTFTGMIWGFVFRAGSPFGIIVLALGVFFVVLFWRFSRRIGRSARYIITGAEHCWVTQQAARGTLPPHHALAINSIRVALLERECRNPRDRSFSLSAILTKLGARTRKPDYALPVRVILTALMQDLLSFEPFALIMLLDAGGLGRCDPSWVPNWGEKFRSPSAWLTSGYSLGSCPSCVSQTERPFICFDGSHLILSGRLVSPVVSRTPPFSQSELPPTHSGLLEISRCVILWIYSAQQYAKNIPLDFPPYRDEGEYLTAALRGRVLSRNTFYENNDLGDILIRTNRQGQNDTPLQRRLRSFVEKLGNWANEYLLPHDKPGDPKEYQYMRTLCCLTRTMAAPNDLAVSRCMDRAYKDESIRDHFLSASLALAKEGRCLFVLENGFVGSGPPNIRLGDQVFCLSGVPTPMVLRRVPSVNSYQVVGASLVHGLMDDAEGKMVLGNIQQFQYVRLC